MTAGGVCQPSVAVRAALDRRAPMPIACRHVQPRHPRLDPDRPSRPARPKGVPSGFVKTRRDGPVEISADGLDGDQRTDLGDHNAPDKAVYAYGLGAYPLWRAALPRHAALFEPGGFGENLTIGGLDEASVCIGDIVTIGTARLQVTEPREPCFKLALRYADAGMVKAMVRNGLTGWYHRVLTPGVATAGDAIVLDRRLNPGWPIARFHRFITAGATRDEIAELNGLDGLPEYWLWKTRKLLDRLAI